MHFDMLFEGSLVCVSLVALVAKVSPQCVSSCASVNHKKKHKHSCTGYTCSAFLPFGAFPIAAWEEISFQQNFFFKTSFFSSQVFSIFIAVLQSFFSVLIFLCRIFNLIAVLLSLTFLDCGCGRSFIFPFFLFFFNCSIFQFVFS